MQCSSPMKIPCLWMDGWGNLLLRLRISYFGFCKNYLGSEAKMLECQGKPQTLDFLKGEAVLSFMFYSVAKQTDGQETKKQGKHLTTQPSKVSWHFQREGIGWEEVPTAHSFKQI